MISKPDTNPIGETLSRVIADQAVIRIGLPAVLVSGTLLGVIGLSTRDYVLLGVGAMALAMAALVRVQTWRQSPMSGPLLALVSTAFGVLAPFADGGFGVTIAPVLVILGFLGIFSTNRRTAARIALWCAALTVWAIYWVYPGLTWTDWLVVTLVLGGTAVCAYAVFAWSDEARVKQEQSHWLLFEASPIAIWELDYTGVIRYFERLRAEGVSDIRTHFDEVPDALEQAANGAVVRRVNSTATRLGNAAEGGTIGDFVRSATPNQRDLAVDIIAAAWEGSLDLSLDVKRTLGEDGRRLDAVVHWSVPVVNDRPDYGRVIMTASDLTAVRDAEERLAAAIASNQLLSSHEQAIAICSQALLLGGDSHGLQLALETLRIATEAESVHLLRREAGPDRTLEVAARSGATDVTEMTLPWSRGSEGLRLLAGGRVIDEMVSTPQGPIARLAVPIFAGGEWLGAFWLEDSGRHRWPPEAIKLLVVAAPMFGAQWDRENNRTRLEELVASKDRFIATVSHELRTPLAAVVGFAELLRDSRDEIDSADLTEMLDTIAGQSQDMAYMVEDLLVAARADIGTITVRPQEVFLRAQVEVTLAGLDTGRLEAVEVRGGPGRAWADPGRTRQIVRNLLTNAVRYGGEKVVVECDTVDNTSVLTVTDNGDGLPQSEWERIFEPYQRAHDPATETASIGLGLTVSRQLARLMGGDLTYRFAPSESVFELSLPAGPPF